MCAIYHGTARCAGIARDTGEGEVVGRVVDHALCGIKKRSETIQPGRAEGAKLEELKRACLMGLRRLTTYDRQHAH